MLAFTVVIVTVVFLNQQSQPPSTVLVGSMFVSDAGRSHGGFEYNAEWNATLSIRGASGT